MSTLKALKEYLVGDGGYLLNDDNNGKTVMLSGAWGSGKTHFWQNEIVRKQSKIIVNKRKRNKYSPKELKEGLFALLKKKKKSCVYVSLYGKDNIEDIKSEVFTKAYSQIPTKGNKDKNIDTAVTWLGYGSKIVSAVSVFGVKIDTTQATDKAKDYIDNEKLNKAQEAIRDGGVICFDDFERKSKNIDLNDLFGVLTQLSLDFNCKVVIILNSDVFEGEEANVFKTVKEKTVNKFFYFDPGIDELFNSIYESNGKYEKLDDYRGEILKAIEATEELNARIYIQVLDNCLEWVEKGYSNDALRSLVLSTVNFTINHTLFKVLEKEGKKFPEIFDRFPSVVTDLIQSLINAFGVEKSIYESLRYTIYSDKVRSPSPNAEENPILITKEQKDICSKFIEENELLIESILLYFFKLKCYDSPQYDRICLFIKSGIIQKNDKEFLS